MQCQEPHKLRQHDPQAGRHRERRNAAHHEHRLPPEQRDQTCRRQPCHHGPDGETGEHQHNPGRAQSLWREFADQNDGVRHRCVETDAGQEAQQHQRGDRRCPRRGQCKTAKQPASQDDGPLATDAIADAANMIGPDHQPEYTDAEDRPEAADLHMPFARDSRKSRTRCRRSRTRRAACRRTSSQAGSRRSARPAASRSAPTRRRSVAACPNFSRNPSARYRKPRTTTISVIARSEATRQSQPAIATPPLFTATPAATAPAGRSATIPQARCS